MKVTKTGPLSYQVETESGIHYDIMWIKYVYVICLIDLLQMILILECGNCVVNITYCFFMYLYNIIILS